MLEKLPDWLSREDGATAIEYAIIAGGIGLAIVASVLFFGDNLQALFTVLATPLSDIQAAAELPTP